MSTHDCTLTQKERREAKRHPLALPVEIHLHSSVDPAGSIVFAMKDVSLRGFYFHSDRVFKVGSTFDFSVLPSPPHREASILIRGTGRTVRFDQLPNGDFGVGAVIEQVAHLDEFLRSHGQG